MKCAGVCLLSSKSVWVGKLSSLHFVCSCAESVILFYLIGLQQLRPKIYYLQHTQAESNEVTHSSSSASAHFINFINVFRSVYYTINLTKMSFWLFYIIKKVNNSTENSSNENRNHLSKHQGIKNEFSTVRLFYVVCFHRHWRMKMKAFLGGILIVLSEWSKLIIFFVN